MFSETKRCLQLTVSLFGLTWRITLENYEGDSRECRESVLE